VWWWRRKVYSKQWTRWTLSVTAMPA
jgi:hypothetical protein